MALKMRIGRTMRKIILAGLLVVVLSAGRRADACSDSLWIPDWFAEGFGIALVGGYGYGTGYFIDEDLTTDRRDMDYVTGELAFNGIAGTIWGMATVEAISDHSAYALPFAAMTTLHGALTVHALEHVSVDVDGKQFGTA